jgi:hypothetical protein
MTRETLRAQMLAALDAMRAFLPVNPGAAATVLATLQPLYTAALAASILGTEATTLAVWIGEWAAA